MQSQHDKQKSTVRLDSWKAIAAFFGRDERTVKRWEKRRGLPVHRLPGGEKGGVFAYRAELAEWLESAREKPRHSPSHGRLPEDSREPGPSPDSSLPSQASPNRYLGLLIALVALILVTAILAYTLGYKHREKKAAVIAPPSSGPGTPAVHTPNPEAHELYLKGRYYWSRRTPGDLNRAVDYFNQAIAKDPGYAQAYMGLADSYNLLREYSAMPPSEAFPRALAAARKAVELDPSSAEAHNSLAFATFYGNWDAPDAEREFKRAIELNPRYDTAHHWYATFLMTVGRFPESMEEIERARDLNPASASILADQGLILFYSGQQDRSIGQLRQLESAEPDFTSPHRYLSLIDLVNGNYRDYLAELTKDAQLTHDPESLAVAQAGLRGYSTGDSRAMLQAILSQQKMLYQKGRMPAYSLSQTEAMLGNTAQSLKYLQTSFAKHESSLIALRIDPLLANLHREPTYRNLLAQVGLPPLSISRPAAVQRR